MANIESDKEYKIRIKKGDFEVEVQGDKLWVEQKFKELTKEVKEKKLEALSEEKTPKTLAEFLEMKHNPQKHTELVTVFAYWLLKVEKEKTFNVKDIIACYDKTRRVKPKNANQIINTNIKSNLFFPADETKDGYKAWFLTHTGEEFVKNLR